MKADDTLASERFPRSSKYNPEWIVASASGGANSLWLTEWLTSAMDLQPGMRVLDLGCGRAASSIFLHREFGVEVGAADLWFDPAENQERIRNAGVQGGVIPIWADARFLPFEPESFDAIICLDSFTYFGTDDLYLNYLAQFVKPGGQMAMAGAGLVQEIGGEVPDHLKGWWTHDLWALHSATWWRRHWERTGIVDIETADTMEDGWKVWLDWHRTVAPENATEVHAIEEDAGRYLGYIRVVGRRNAEVKLQEYCWPGMRVPPQYTRVPLLRDGSVPLPPASPLAPGDHSKASIHHTTEDVAIKTLWAPGETQVGDRLGHRG